MRRPRWWPVPPAGPGRARLPDGRTLRLLTAQELLDARREAVGLVRADRERALCANACLLARAVERRGKAVWSSGAEVLAACTPARIEELARRWSELDRRRGPGLDATWEEVDALKKACGTRRRSACAGACCTASARCRPRRGRGR